MFAAGTETLSSTVDWAMTELIKIRVMVKVQDDIRQTFNGSVTIKNYRDTHTLKYLKLVIKET